MGAPSLIRSRSSAGDPEVYKRFLEQVESAVFVPATSDNVSPVALSFENVRTSKYMIDREQGSKRGFNVKLGKGGIREIEFIAQALQLAYGGIDRWLRAPHTLISLSRLADRGLISESELTQLFNAYEFLRRLEHVLQMENGLQTHTLPDEADRRSLVARRMRLPGVTEFNAELKTHTKNVHRVFQRLFQPSTEFVTDARDTAAENRDVVTSSASAPAPETPTKFARDRESYTGKLQRSVAGESDYRHQLGAFRRSWSGLIKEISDAERDGLLDVRSSKRAQTALAEASIDIALDLTRQELNHRYKLDITLLPLAVMGLGKLGGGAIDYESDLDLVLVFDQDAEVPVREPLPSSTRVWPKFLSRHYRA
jgi:glutamine synthetase adenylyltransferase